MRTPATTRTMLESILGEVRSLLTEVRALREEVRAIRRPRPARVSISLYQAAKSYGKRPETLRTLWEAGKIDGTIVPGSGPSGKVLRLSVASLDRLFGIKP